MDTDTLMSRLEAVDQRTQKKIIGALGLKTWGEVFDLVREDSVAKRLVSRILKVRISEPTAKVEMG
jgi:hypothetical protein